MYGHADPARYTENEWRNLQELRLRYWLSRDLWNARELAHLRFVRWQVQTGLLILDGETEAPSEAGTTQWRTGMTLAILRPLWWVL